MTTVEAVSLYAAISAYVLVAGLGVFGRFVSKRFERGLAPITVAGIIGQSISIASRWAAIGHPPVFGTFENTLAGSLFLVSFGLLVFRRWRRIFNPLPGLCLSAVLIMWLGLRFDTAKIPLTISERSLWVDLHAVVAWLTYSGLSVAFVVALLALTGKGRLYRGLARLPFAVPAGGLAEDIMAGYVNFVFVMMTATITSGAYYAFLTFGRWWRWDPVESLTLSSWFVLALFIHLRRSFGWRGGQLAWLVVIAFALAVVSYWFLVFLPPGATFHVFDVGRRVHIF